MRPFMAEARLRACAAAASLALLGAATACARPSSALSQTADGVVFHYGVVPAEVVRAHPVEQPERRMHGDPGKASHVVLALFDAATGERITAGRVRATVTPLGGAPQTRPLEAMPIAGAASFGNFFSLSTTGVYRIRFEVERDGHSPSIAEFEYRVPAR